MAKKLIHVADGRAQLHCDNPKCGHVMPPGYLDWGPWLIGFACPECGSDMLTEKDFLAGEKMFAVIAWINKWFGWLGRERPPEPGEGVQFSMRPHDGKIHLK